MPRDFTDDALRVAAGQYSYSHMVHPARDACAIRRPDEALLASRGAVAVVATCRGAACAEESGAGLDAAGEGRAASDAATMFLAAYYATPVSVSVPAAARSAIEMVRDRLATQHRAMSAGCRAPHLGVMMIAGATAHVLTCGICQVYRLTAQGQLEPLTGHVDAETGLPLSSMPSATGVIGQRRTSVAPNDIFVLTSRPVDHWIDGETVNEEVQKGSLNSAARALALRAETAGLVGPLAIQIVRIDALSASDPASMFDLAALPVPVLPGEGALLDGFRILRRLHASAYAHVFLAAAPDGRRVALKLPGPETAATPARLRRFALEAWVTRRVDSPHVLRGLHMRQRQEQLYIATNYLSGPTLRGWMDEHRAPDPEQVVRIVSQIAVGLRALHRRDLLHRDLRPENVMFDTDGTVRIIGFGAAAVPGADATAPLWRGPVPGALAYAAPEVLAGRLVSWRTDQYALATIAYEMFTGHLPYGPESAMIASARARRRLTYRPARAQVGQVPDWIDAALRRATHPDPARRYDRLSHFLADLQHPAQDWTPARGLPLSQRNPLAFWQGLAAVLATVCAVLFARMGG
ncbi:hypothetical protein DKT77_00700 [Meridianimarinicoccus roseus]|uniref:Protein kinase domain-containing protein n=1 Tax=Meridianimarinicoccus roseus TaxID=2072018 RepID=A0A2V2LFW2_9RHOB|nr:serine/threonine-protein kinase [Meridianimarinicoccus roseus]PWR04520.1 hypothetical protein DKT77_00700 [Meridianimarinicoccus roseus]